jgi:hypothetical protein
MTQMADAVYVVTFLTDHPPYAAGEAAAFVAKDAAKLFALGLGSLSSGDQSTLSAEIDAAKRAFPLKPITATVQINPDGTTSILMPSAAQKYGI